MNAFREYASLGLEPSIPRQVAAPPPIAVVTVRATSDRWLFGGAPVEIGRRYELPKDVAASLFATGKAALAP